MTNIKRGKSMIKVSIIVPVYNVERYLAICLDSLISQTLKEIEIICVNDGSTDCSGQIIEEFAKADERVKIITQSNTGPSVARNNGMKIASGEYIAFCDSDDWVDLDYYEKLYNAAKSYNCDIAVAGMKKLKKGKIKIFQNFSETTTAVDFYKKIIICDVPDYCYVCNKIYKTSSLKQSGLEFKPGTYYEDIFFTPQVLYNLGSLVCVTDSYYYYRMREGSIIHTNKYRADSVKALDFAVNYLEENGIPRSVMTVVKKYKLFGLTLVKTKTKNDMMQLTLFNIFKYTAKSGLWYNLNQRSHKNANSNRSRSRRI